MYLAALTVIAESIKNRLLPFLVTFVFSVPSPRDALFPAVVRTHLWIIKPLNDGAQQVDKDVISPQRAPGDPRVFVCSEKKMSGILSRISQREKPGFSVLMMLKVNGEQIVDAARLMSVQGLDFFDLLINKQAFKLGTGG